MSPRRNHNANPDRARRRRCTAGCGGRAMYDNGPDLAGLCDDCADLAAWGALPAPELENDPATWTIPSDGYSDGGTPYSDDELNRANLTGELERRPAA